MQIRPFQFKETVVSPTVRGVCQTTGTQGTHCPKSRWYISKVQLRSTEIGPPSSRRLPRI